MTIHDSLASLSARLPELEWKLNTGRVMINPTQLPRGLFRERLEMTAQSCVDDVKADLLALTNQPNERSVRFLAERVSRKINVLIRLCQVTPALSSSSKPVRSVALGVQTISTRQQWLQSLQREVDCLTEQHAAVYATISERSRSGAMRTPEILLGLQAELGELDRRLTLAKEVLSRAVHPVD